MKKVCIFTLYCSKGASSKYRILQYEDPLKKNFKIRVFSFWNNNYIEKYMGNKRKYLFQIVFLYIFAFLKRIAQLFFIASKTDVVLFQKTCIPKVGINLISFLKRRGIKIVLDIDDPMYVYKRDQTNDIAAKADLVICGNKILVDHYKKYCDNCIYIPTVENTSLYVPFRKDTYDKKIIGWIGNKSTIYNIDLVVNAINQIVYRHPNVKFRIISDTMSGYDNLISNCEFVKWSEESYLEDLAEISIGIMPLFDNELNSGKCGFKLVQYLNMYKPVVASDVGINRELVGKCGYIATSEKEWFDQMELLLFDRNAYEECVGEIENGFLPFYDYDVVAEQIIDALDKI